jgi:hypothetical protein
MLYQSRTISVRRALLLLSLSNITDCSPYWHFLHTQA